MKAQPFRVKPELTTDTNPPPSIVPSLLEETDALLIQFVIVLFVAKAAMLAGQKLVVLILPVTRKFLMVAFTTEAKGAVGPEPLRVTLSVLPPPSYVPLKGVAEMFQFVTVPTIVVTLISSV